MLYHSLLLDGIILSVLFVPGLVTVTKLLRKFLLFYFEMMKPFFNQNLPLFPIGLLQPIDMKVYLQVYLSGIQVYIGNIQVYI